jgi:hypothetical protein
MSPIKIVAPNAMTKMRTTNDAAFAAAGRNADAGVDRIPHTDIALL